MIKTVEKGRTIRLLVILLGICALTPPAWGQPDDPPVRCPEESFHADSDPEQNPELFAWELFAYANHGISHKSSTVRWQQWASPEDLYCDTKGNHCDPKHRPQWIRLTPSERLLGPIIKLEMLERPQASFQSIISSGHPDMENGEEIRMNCAAFKYIADNYLWYLEGQEEAFKSGKEVVFPSDAIEIKAFWIPIDREARHRYLSHRIDNAFYGLLAWSITSKVLPQWFWATFEHVDNPNRCLGNRCEDSTIGINHSIDTGLKARIVTLLKKKGLVNSRWLNYRLTGVQFEFVNPDGSPTKAANSILEASLVAATAATSTSSCITCHSRATVDYQGNRLCPGQAKNLGYVGAPARSWFCDDSGKLKFLPLGFVWSLQEAQSIHRRPEKDAGACGEPAPVQPESPYCDAIPLLTIH